MSLSLDPEVAEARLRFLGEQVHSAPLPVGDVTNRRRQREAVHARIKDAYPVPDDVAVRDFSTTTADGAELLLRWYTKRGADPGSAVLYLHGGGMILSSVALYDGAVGRHVSATGVPFLSVEYRLAPEFPHPTPIEDAFTGLTWLTEHAHALGIDPARVAVMGDSAGGGLAAGVALLARDRGGPGIARQILLYPMLDDRTTIPDPELVALAAWSYEDNATGWQALLADAHGGPGVSPYAAPARMTHAAGLPPLYLEALELDIFRDENIEYARRSAAAGVPTELHVHPGVPHGFERMAPDTAVARRIMADRIRVIRAL